MRISSQSSTTELQQQPRTGTTKKVIDESKISTNSCTLSTPKMAGDFRVVDRKKPRKLWSTLDRPSFNVDLLKANLADDGNEECQLEMAKKFLDRPADVLEGSPQMRERQRLAVYWLIKSGEQGNEEASALLSQCLNAGQGITVQNISDVRSCISTPKNDKLVFKAARLLYEKLSNGEEFITTAQLNGVITAWKLRGSPGSNSTQSTTADDDDSMNKIFTVDDESDSEMSQSLSKNVDKIKMRNMMQESDVVKLTKSDLLKLASAYNKGEIPQIAIDCDTKQSQRYTNWHLQSLAHAFLVQLLLLSLVTKALTLHSALIIIASLLILWTAFNFIMWRKKLLIFEDWTIAFKCVLNNHSLNHTTSQNKLWSNRIRPLTLTNFGCLCALYVLDGPPFINFVLAAVTVVSILHGIFYEHFGWQTKFMIFTTIASFKSFANYYEEFFSYFSDYTKDWLFSGLQLDRSSFFLFEDYAEWTTAANFQIVFMMVNLVIISASYVLSSENTKITPFLEQFLLIGHLIQADAAIAALTTNELYLCIGVAIIVLVFFLLLERTKDLWKIVLGTTLTIIFVLGTVIALVMISNSHAITKNANGNEANHQRITWEEYSAKCHRKAWKDKTIPETQIKCTLMYGFSPTFVSWTGRISNVKISHMIPKSFAQLKRSKAASATTDDDEMIRVGGVTFDILLNIENPPGSDEGGHTWQSFLTGGGGGDEKQLNIVSILISTKGVIGHQEKVKVIRQILSFRVGDQIQVDGVLLNGFGGLKPEIGKISLIKCVECSKVKRGEEFLFSSKSLIFDYLDPFEEYMGSQLITFLSELENSIFSVFS